MARLVVKNNITSGGALVVGQTLQLGGFVMTARSSAAPTMTSRVIENSLHISSKFTDQMDPMELSSLNERFTQRGRMPAAGILAWKWSKFEIPIPRNSQCRKNQRGLFFLIYKKY